MPQQKSEVCQDHRFSFMLRKMQFNQTTRKSPFEIELQGSDNVLLTGKLAAQRAICPSAANCWKCRSLVDDLGLNSASFISRFTLYEAIPEFFQPYIFLLLSPDAACEHILLYRKVPTPPVNRHPLGLYLQLHTAVDLSSSVALQISKVHLVMGGYVFHGVALGE
jgi:hypothetical protein